VIPGSLLASIEEIHKWIIGGRMMVVCRYCYSRRNQRIAKTWLPKLSFMVGCIPSL